MESTTHRRENDQKRRPTPLPKFQLCIIFLIQFAEPVTALVIYPFINQFVRDTGITRGDETMTGYYAGMIESTFFLAECLTVIQWGYLSDRFGRRPVLLIGPLGLSVSMLMFGLSTTFWPLVFFRCLQGTFNGNIGVSKSVIAEISDETNIGDAYALIPIMWSMATTITPFIGGVFSQPANRWPDIFGRVPFFQTHPYFLPCATAASIAFITFVVAFFGLKETLSSLILDKNVQDIQRPDSETIHIQHGDDVSCGSESPEPTESSEATPLLERQTHSSTHSSTGVNNNTNLYALLHRPLLLVFLNYVFLTFLEMANTVLLPLMYSTPIEYGGLGLTPLHIGTMLGCFGTVNAVIQAKFLGRLMRRLGTRKLYQLGIASLCIPFLVYPLTKHFSRRVEGVDAFVLCCIVIQMASLAPIYMAFASMQVLIVQSVPEGGPLGTANGIGQMLASGMRTIAPSFASSLFSVSLQRNLAGGNLVYYILLGLTVLGVFSSTLLVDPLK